MFYPTTLGQELYDTLLEQYNIEIYGCKGQRGSKVIEFYCKDDKIKQILNKGLHNKYHNYILGVKDDRFNLYYCNFTRRQ